MVLGGPGISFRSSSDVDSYDDGVIKLSVGGQGRGRGLRQMIVLRWGFGIRDDDQGEGEGDEGHGDGDGDGGHGEREVDEGDEKAGVTSLVTEWSPFGWLAGENEREGGIAVIRSGYFSFCFLLFFLFVLGCLGFWFRLCTSVSFTRLGCLFIPPLPPPDGGNKIRY